MRPSIIISALLSGLAVQAAMLHDVLVSYSPDVPDYVLDNAKKAVVDAVSTSVTIAFLP